MNISICPGCSQNWRLHRPQGDLDCPWRLAPASSAWIKLPDELNTPSGPAETSANPPLAKAGEFEEWWTERGGGADKLGAYTAYLRGFLAGYTAAGRAASGAQQWQEGFNAGSKHERELQKFLAAPAPAQLSASDVLHLLVEMTDGIDWKWPELDGHISRFTAKLNALLRSQPRDTAK